MCGRAPSLRKLRVRQGPPPPRTTSLSLSPEAGAQRAGVDGGLHPASGELPNTLLPRPSNTLLPRPYVGTWDLLGVAYDPLATYGIPRRALNPRPYTPSARDKPFQGPPRFGLSTSLIRNIPPP